MNQYKLIWTSLTQFEPIWTNLIWFDLIWTNFISFEANNESDSYWSNLNQCEPMWTNLNQSEPIWTNLNQSEPNLTLTPNWTDSNLSEPIQIYPNLSKSIHPSKLINYFWISVEAGWLSRWWRDPITSNIQASLMALNEMEYCISKGLLMNKAFMIVTR